MTKKEREAEARKEIQKQVNNTFGPINPLDAVSVTSIATFTYLGGTMYIDMIQNIFGVRIDDIFEALVTIAQGGAVSALRLAAEVPALISNIITQEDNKEVKRLNSFKEFQQAQIDALLAVQDDVAARAAQKRLDAADGISEARAERRIRRRADLMLITMSISVGVVITNITKEISISEVGEIAAELLPG
jgi:hypothetical protein